jgi:hypothetical protein
MSLIALKKLPKIRNYLMKFAFNLRKQSQVDTWNAIRKHIFWGNSPQLPKNFLHSDLCFNVIFT